MTRSFGETRIGQHLRKSGRHLVVVNSIVLGLCAVILAYNGLSIALALVALVAGRNIWCGVARQRNPFLHPSAQALTRLGPPSAIANQLDASWDQNARQVGLAHLCDGWLLRLHTFGADVVRIEEVVWVYRKVTEPSRYWIKTGTTQTLIVKTQQLSIELGGSEADVRRLMDELTRRAPWAVFGYSDAVEATWAKNRPALVAAVSGRIA